MADAQWPAYPIGHRDSIFALGVASSKFAELESALEFVFGSVLDIPGPSARLIVNRIGNKPTLELLKRHLAIADWRKAPRMPATADTDVDHFRSGFNVCATNRDLLMHSAFGWEPSEPVLFKMTKQGGVEIANPDISEIRQVADDMHVYAEYGRRLGNALNTRKLDPPIFPDAAFPWPDRPSPPHSLRYTADPLPRS